MKKSLAISNNLPCPPNDVLLLGHPRAGGDPGFSGSFWVEVVFFCSCVDFSEAAIEVL
jgi:hypothetical protein